MGFKLGARQVCKVEEFAGMRTSRSSDVEVKNGSIQPTLAHKYGCSACATSKKRGWPIQVQESFLDSMQPTLSCMRCIVSLVASTIL